jgi:hypothetical protein
VESVESVEAEGKFLNVGDLYLHSFVGLDVADLDYHDVLRLLVHLPDRRFFSLVYGLGELSLGFFFFLDSALHPSA